MWPLHARTKDEYVRMIQTHLERQERRPLQDLINQAFDDYGDEEEFAAWCTSVAHGTECENAANLLAQFIERFPLSLHPVQVDLAERLISSGYIDHGSNEARAYLARVCQPGLAETMSKHDLVRDGCSRALLMVTAIYTEMGARSYSRRLLEYAMMLPVEHYWVSRFQSEHLSLGEELRRVDASRYDKQWEAFLSSNKDAGRIAKLCRDHNAPILARRVEVLSESRVGATPCEPLGDDEFFQLLYQTEQGAWVLA